MEKPNRAFTVSELAEARERIEALTGLLDAIAALADHPAAAKPGDPAAVCASQRANDLIAVYASATGATSAASLRNSAETIAKQAARPVPYATRDSGAFGGMRAAYLARRCQPGADSAEPEAGR